LKQKDPKVHIYGRTKGCKMNEYGVDINIYLAFTKALIKKYGNFKVTPELHNKIIEKLSDICWEIENNKGNK
jgi:hypothetical protein